MPQKKLSKATAPKIRVNVSGTGSSGAWQMNLQTLEENRRGVQVQIMNDTQTDGQTRRDKKESLVSVVFM